MLWIARQRQEGFHRGIYEGKSQIEAKQLHNLHYNIEEGLHLMVVLPCDLCPHHHQQHHRFLRDSSARSGDEWSKQNENDKTLTEEELEAAAQLMDLSSQSLHLADDLLTFSKSSTQDEPEPSAVSDGRPFCGVTPSPARVSVESMNWRRIFDVEIDERPKPRSRCLSEICDPEQQLKAFKRKKLPAST
eukprot:Gb_22407 [translate_table: standard]